MKVAKLKRNRLLAAKRAFTTRRIPSGRMRTVVTGDIRPKSGDCLLATVDRIGKQQRIELPNGRRARIFPGDEIVVCYGNRYAPDQFEAVVGDDLSGCDLVAAGGIAATEICRHERMLEPTRILPIGLIGDSRGRVVNVADHAIEVKGAGQPIPTIIVAGTSMNAGKTFTAASLVRGFRNAGFKVAGIKATGTGSGGDLWYMSDMGAHRVLDFTDAGLASTYKAPTRAIEEAVFGLIDHASEINCQIAIVEIADGLQHEETAILLGSEGLRRRCLGVVFAAYDALGAKAGTEMLMEMGHKTFAVSGQLTRSPLAIRETVMSTGLPVLSPLELQAGALCDSILESGLGMPIQTGVPGAVLNGTAPDADAVEIQPAQESRRLLRAQQHTQRDVLRWLEGQGDETADLPPPVNPGVINGRAGEAKSV